MEISRRKVIVWGGELKKEIQFDVPDRTVFYQDRDCRRNFFSLKCDLLSRHICFNWWKQEAAKPMCFI